MFRKQVCILFFLSCIWLNAQNTEEVYADEKTATPVNEFFDNPEKLVTDEVLTERYFKSDFREKYSGEVFDYTRTKPKESLWDKFKRFINRIFSKIFFNANPHTISKFTIIFIRVFSAVIIVLLLYFFIKIIANKKGNWFFSKKNKKLEINDSDIIEDINEIDFNAVISQYELEGNYNSAFRYRFLSVLKNLTDSGKIKWTKEKTNIDYLYEISNPKDKKLFERAVYLFNHVWYGDFKINQSEYEKFTKEIEMLKTEVYE